MFTNKTKVMIAAMTMVLFVLCGAGFADQVPYENSNVRYFYVFGSDGDPLMGAEDSKLELVIDVPVDGSDDVVIGVFDPNTGGKKDWKKPTSEWNTTTKFSVYGAGLLDSEEFGEFGYDGEYYNFGPYPKTKGKKIGNFYRFKLVAEGVSGDDQNLFKVRVLPNSAEVFSKNITFRLLPTQGDKMYFYPEVPAGMKTVIVKNYDLDVNGGTSTLSVRALSKKYPINDSQSGEWAETVVPISSETGGRLFYTITKATQRYANAGLMITDDKGEALPVYFVKGTPPVVKKAAPVRKPAPRKSELKCNKFTFDATSSYDVDNQKLSYLWNFGDGQTSTEPVVTHIYDKGGEYTVTLNVKDSSGLPCDSDGTSQKVYVNTPPVASFAAPILVCAQDEVTFDASATTDDAPANLTYMWKFGDGDSDEGKRVTHAYDKGGEYNVTLVVDDNSGTACNLDSLQKKIRVNTSPVAVAGKDVTMCLYSLDEAYTVELDGSSSRDVDGNDLSYTWSLGDGTTEKGQSITHTYGQGGIYNVKLTVDDGSGLACSNSADNLTVNLNKAPVAVAGSDKKACTGRAVTFDGSGSKTERGETLSYDWSFGDGEGATGKTASHTYKKGGKYTAFLTVDDGKDTPCSISSSTILVNVNSMPYVNLVKVDDTCVGKKVKFDASDSKDPDGDKLTYLWNFGDGTRVEGGARESHVYEKGGNYNVSVTVDDEKDSLCSVASDTIKIKINTPPSAKVNITKACCVNMEQKFSAAGSTDPDGDSLIYTWDFGDGTTARGATVSHVYTEPGTYKVLLKVDDGSGTECSSDLAADHINVNAKPVAVIKIK
jgi:large repetitive protein